MPTRVVPHCRDCRNCRVRMSRHRHYVFAYCHAGHGHPVPLEEIEQMGGRQFREAWKCPDWEE